jgi:hypothetical protein
VATVLAGSRFVTVRILYLMLIRLPAWLAAAAVGACAFCGLERCKSEYQGSWSWYLEPRGSLHGKEKVYGSIP